MAIDRKLDWLLQEDKFNTDEKRVLLGLSFKQHRWMTIDGLMGVTRLDYDEVAGILTDLLRQDLVMGSFDYGIQEPIFGLVERNDPAYKKRRRAAVR